MAIKIVLCDNTGTPLDTEPIALDTRWVAQLSTPPLRSDILPLQKMLEQRVAMARACGDPDSSAQCELDILSWYRVEGLLP
jgi:hypothetical protein